MLLPHSLPRLPSAPPPYSRGLAERMSSLRLADQIERQYEASEQQARIAMVGRRMQHHAGTMGHWQQFA